MSAERLREQIAGFFARWGGASLKLPNGWFGRPLDNFHELTDISIVGEEVIIELDERLLLSLKQPASATVDGRVLRISGFEQADWTWSEYDSGVPHHEEFEGGAVEFFAHG